MNRDEVLLQGLRGQLNGWVLTIQRSTGASVLEFLPRTAGEFALQLSWATPTGAKTYTKEFTKEYVFGMTFRGSPHARAVQKRACEYARAVIREVLEQRGVL